MKNEKLKMKNEKEKDRKGRSGRDLKLNFKLQEKCPREVLFSIEKVDLS